jgi:hypothetical protein
MRLASGAVLVPVSQLQFWHDRASATPGLTDLDRKVLAAIATWHQRLYVEDFAGSLSHRRLAQRMRLLQLRHQWRVRLNDAAVLADPTST